MFFGACKSFDHGEYRAHRGIHRGNFMFFRESDIAGTKGFTLWASMLLVVKGLRLATQMVAPY
jgi:hypothetical protein